MSTRAEAIERYEHQLLDLAAVFDERVAVEDYPVALLCLGHRSRTLYRAFLELHADDAATASRTLLRPLVEAVTGMPAGDESWAAADSGRPAGMHRGRQGGAGSDTPSVRQVDPRVDPNVLERPPLYLSRAQIWLR